MSTFETHHLLAGVQLAWSVYDRDLVAFEGHVPVGTVRRPDQLLGDRAAGRRRRAGREDTVVLREDETEDVRVTRAQRAGIGGCRESGEGANQRREDSENGGAHDLVTGESVVR